MADMHFYEPASGHGLAHNPMKAIIAPRPIGWISSRSDDGVLNLAPYSFFNAFSYVPPIIGFCSSGRKDSLNNIRRNGEFAWSLVTRGLAEAMNRSSAPAPAHVDEFALSGVTPASARIIGVPWVAESPVAFECRCSQIVQLQRADGSELESWLVLGEVVGVHIDRRLIKDGAYDTAAARPVMRGGGLSKYFEIAEELSFDLDRPDYP
jgi:flavin reductase (DIM6/NTAB) family NADH-FMN oxidoreductase RutF